MMSRALGNNGNTTPPQGRFPANLIHDGSEEVTGLFPETQSGVMKAKTQRANRSGFTGNMPTLTAHDTPADSGSAARFFYCAKASKQDRDEGLEEFDYKKKRLKGGTGTGISDRENIIAKNNHPTVKPTPLMQYLVRLVTPAGGTVLDPFMGSGSTGRGCKLEEFCFIGIELDPEYCAIARARIEGAEAGRTEFETGLTPAEQEMGQQTLFGE